jgi:hypothetical protein
MQQAVVTEQIAEYFEQFKTCPDCGAHRTRKGQHPLVYRTLFGKFNFISPRLYDCPCQNHGRHSSSPLTALLVAHCAPELLYLETRFTSLMSDGLSVELLTEVLPIAEEISPTSVRRHLQRVAERIEAELGEEQVQFIEGCPSDWAKQPPPGPPLTVGLDGGYVHASHQKSKTDGWFEVIAGKSVQTEGGAKVFAFVNKYDTKPKRRLYEVLKTQGLQMNQQVVILSDGGDTVRDLQHYLSPESEHLLDWFHITMRLTVVRQMTKGMTVELKPGDKCPETAPGLADLENTWKASNGISGMATFRTPCNGLMTWTTIWRCWKRTWQTGRNWRRQYGNSAPISGPTRRSFRTTVTATGTMRRFPRRLSRRP